MTDKDNPMLNSSPIRLLIDGASKRCIHLWAPLFKAFRGDIEVVGVVSRSESSARTLGDQFSVPYGTDFDAMVSRTRPDSVFVCVTAEFNGMHGIKVVGRGLNMLGETPIAWKVDEAYEICSLSQQKRVTVEITENKYRMPIHLALRSFLDTGALGRLHTVMCDGFMHEYHAFGTARAMIGFDKVPRVASGFERHFPLEPDTSDEICLDGLVEFETGELVGYHWQNGGYSSAVRPFRVMKLVGTAGSALVQLPGDGGPRAPTIALSCVKGGTAVHLESRYVHDPDQTGRVRAIDFVDATGRQMHRWENPLYSLQQSLSVSWNEDQASGVACIQDFLAAVKRGQPLTYGPHNARVDQEICVAIRRSKGVAVKLPME